MPVTILIVDDHEVVREGVRTIINRSRPQWEICGEAANGQEAIDAVTRLRPDIVLLDGNLPKIDGFEVCRRIRHESKTPIIMLTARDEEEDILRGLQIGADDYMTKPFSAKQLAARMKAVMRRCQTDPYRQPAKRYRSSRPACNPPASRTIVVRPPFRATVGLKVIHHEQRNPAQRFCDELRRASVAGAVDPSARPHRGL